MKWKLAIYASLFICALLFLSPGAFSNVEEEFHRTVTVEPGTEVEFESRNGQVYITSWDRDYVDISAIKRTEEDYDALERVTIEVNTNGVLEIKTVYEKWSSEDDSFIKRFLGWSVDSIPDVTVDFTIKLPATVLMRRAEIRNGSLELNRTRGDTILRSRNGSITVDSADQYIDVESRNGNITISGGAVISNAQARNGDVIAYLSGNAVENRSFSTRNGSVDLYLSPDVNAEIEMQTRGGEISTEGIRLMLHKISKEHIVGTLGSGGKTISVNTRNGSISLNSE